MRSPLGLAVAGVAALLIAGCSHGSHPAAAPLPGSTAATTVPIPGTPTTTPGTPPPDGGAATTSTVAPSSTIRPANTAAGCLTSNLAVTVTDLGAAAGTAYKELVFKNTSGRTCTLHGYPGVSFVDAQGRQIGAPAQPQSGTGALVVLAPAMTAKAEIRYHDAYVSTVDNCQPATAAGIRVYPPNQRTSVIVAIGLMVCANPGAPGTADVLPVMAASALNP